MVDNTYYLVGQAPNWQLSKFDAASWKKLAGITIPLDSPRESAGDPMVAYVNGQKNRLYVSYDVDTIDPATHKEQLRWEANVSIYEL
jgi:hypothetical protein